MITHLYIYIYVPVHHRQLRHRQQQNHAAHQLQQPIRFGVIHGITGRFSADAMVM